MNGDRITAWIERARRDGAATIEARLGIERVRAWELGGTDDGELAAEAIAAIQDDAGAQPGHGSLAYRLVAVRSGEREPFARLMVPVHATSIERVATAPPSDATAAATLRVLEDHAREQGALLRDLVRMQIDSRAGDNGLLLEHNRQLTRQVAEYEKRRIALYEAHEAALSQKQQRETEERMAKLAEKRHDYLAERIDMLAPIVLNRLLGGGHGKGAPAGNDMFRSLLGSMTPEQVDALTSGQPFAWSQEQTLLISELYTSFARQEEARRRKRAEAEGPTIQLDANLPEALVARVLTALGNERDPAALEAIAAELDAQYPLAREALRKRAEQLRQEAGASTP